MEGQGVINFVPSDQLLYIENINSGLDNHLSPQDGLGEDSFRNARYFLIRWWGIKKNLGPLLVDVKRWQIRANFKNFLWSKHFCPTILLSYSIEKEIRVGYYYLSCDIFSIVTFWCDHLEVKVNQSLLLNVSIVSIVSLFSS